MRTDYKESSKPATRKKSVKRRTRSGASKTSEASKGWMWGLVGMLVGLFVAFLVYINQNAPVLPPAPEVKVKTRPAVVKKAAIAKPPEPKPAAKSQYGFYQRLENQQVDVDVAKVREERVRQQKLKPKNLALQVGSFRDPADADSMKARMAFMGFESKVVRTESVKHGVWHRVRLGPYSDKRLLQKDRAKLFSNNIESLMITLDSQ